MTRFGRSRLIAGIVLVIAGAACGAAMHGGLGNLLATGLIAAGLLVIVSLAFRHMGLTGDGDSEGATRERDVERRHRH